MLVNEKLIKQISETKYLNTENSYRYRPIMRIFFRHYEKLEYWLYKEDIYNELKENDLFNDYTIDDCERDLETLTEWLSLKKLQDTKNASTIEEFKNKKFRYQLTEYATEIERLTISLEEMEVKTASLEPKLFDKIRILITKLKDIEEFDDSSSNELWEDLNENFTKLNQNYQDFLKKFNEPKSEELLQSVIFLQFKSEMIKYLREFIKGYQKNIHSIRASISDIKEEQIDLFLDKLISFHKKTPLLNKNFDFVQLRKINNDKLKNIFKWFIGSSTSTSEGEKLMDTTNNIIVKLTKYAASLIELHGNMTNRRGEYSHLAKLFDGLDNIDEAHKYASTIFGIENIRHYIGNSNLNTDSIVNTYDIPPIEILLASRTRLKKEKSVIQPIIDKTEEKRKLLEDYRKEQQQNRLILKGLIKDKKITLSKEMELSKIERRYIQKLLGSRNEKETEFGLKYFIKKLDGKCSIKSEDGIFVLNSIEIEFEGDI